jgi:DNA polymerase III subunit gamma/tau
VFFTARARKKKSLTDPISILPFAAQIPGKATENSILKPILKEAENEIKSKVQESTSSYNTPSKPTKLISIQNLLAEEKEKKRRSLEDQAREDFSHDQLIIIWKKYAFEMREQGKDTFFHALTKRDPSFISQEKIELILENNIQVEYIRPLLDDFINFLRSNLNNYFIEIEFTLNTTDLPDTKPLTGKDKFKSMASKNPNLMILKNTFNLDIEY